MKLFLFATLCTLLASGALSAPIHPSAPLGSAATTPEQIHLAITGVPGQRIVSWVTMNITGSTKVFYGLNPNKLDSTAVGTQTYYNTDTAGVRTIYLHDVLLTNLTLNTRYYYRVGDPLFALSATYDFDTKIDVPNTPVDIIIYGDMGTTNSERTIAKLKQELLGGFSSLIIHTGDFAYDMHDSDGRIGDEFMNLIQPVAAFVPYMVCVGNHENDGRSYSQYAARFGGIAKNTPSKSNFHYSFDVNYVHFVAFSTEIYFTTPGQLADQYAWLDADLAAANANRNSTPWIVVFGHRPIYCSNVDDMPDCSSDARTVREGQYSIDDLLAKYKVDMYISAHEHSYELTWPVNHGQYQTFPNPGVYTDPMYTVNIIAGASGCREDLDYYDSVFYGPWSNFRSASYGYGHFTAYNATHLHWYQFLDEGNSGTNDLWIIRSNTTRTGPVPVTEPAAHPKCDSYCYVTCRSASQKSDTARMDMSRAVAACASECGCEEMVQAGKESEIGSDIRVERSLVRRH